MTSIPTQISPGPLPGKSGGPVTPPTGGGTASVHRYPLEPLAAAMGLSMNQACLRLGISGSTQQEYRRRGVTEKVADRLAVRAELVPYEVWPEMADHAIASIEVECARTDCATRFVPRRKGMRYCTSTCKDVEGTRRRRRERPEVAQAARDSAARYRAENRAYVLRREASYQDRNRDQINARQRARYHASKAAQTTQEAG